MHHIARQFRSHVTTPCASMCFRNNDCSIKTAWGDWITAGSGDSWPNASVRGQPRRNSLSYSDAWANLILRQRAPLVA
jgi:hypothetical protein